MNELPVILRTHDIYNAICKITEPMPSLKKQTIGRRLENSVLELLEVLIMAKHAPKPHKSVYLLKASATAETIGFHLNTVLEQKLANETTVHQLIAKNNEIERMLGGWRKSVQ